METKFFICKHCGNITTHIVDSGVRTVCCGETMSEIVPNTVEASSEKHIPVFIKNGNIVTVKIGSMEHPMVQKHYIQWVFLQTKQGFQYKKLNYDDKPEIDFSLTPNDSIIAIYAYCNIHGLWVNYVE